MTSAASLYLPSTPDFQTFASLKAQVLAMTPGIFDASETRLARSLAGELAPVETLACPAVGYRCHVAEHWLECFGLPADWKPRALVSQGVRHSLQTLFAHWAATGRRVALPSDVYPVYQELAHAAGCPVTGYSSFPRASFPDLAQFDVLVVTDPFKPRASALQADELQVLLAWLKGDARRRVVVDAVYQFGVRLSATTMSLVATGQALVLHSLAKGWASPLLAGIALVPEQDVAELTPVFRPLQVDRPRLALAQGMLVSDQGRPAHLAKVLEQRESALRQALVERGVVLPVGDAPAGRYLFVVDKPWTELLAVHAVLALPLSTFGSTLAGFSVMSSLAPL